MSKRKKGQASRSKSPSDMSSSESPPRRFKIEPTTPTYAPSKPWYQERDSEEEEEEEEVDDELDPEKTASKEKYMYRCAFRRERDGMGCTQRSHVKDETLNHFYKYHFDRINPGKVFEENLNCFFTTCHETFSTHEKLVKHMHNHSGNKGSMYHIKYLIDNLEKEKNDEIQELKKEKKRDLEELEKEYENFKKDYEMKEEKSKEDLKSYRKKHDVSKKKLEDDEINIKNLKQEVEMLKEKNKDNEDKLLKFKGMEARLREEKAELKGKLSLQQENCAEANSKLEKLRKKYSNIGPNSDSCLQKKCSKLERQLEVAKKRIKEKDAMLKEKNDEITDLELATGSDDEFMKPSSTTNGEYVESDDE